MNRRIKKWFTDLCCCRFPGNAADGIDDSIVVTDGRPRSVSAAAPETSRAERGPATTSDGDIPENPAVPAIAAADGTDIADLPAELIPEVAAGLDPVSLLALSLTNRRHRAIIEGRYKDLLSITRRAQAEWRILETTGAGAAAWVDALADLAIGLAPDQQAQLVDRVLAIPDETARSPLITRLGPALEGFAALQQERLVAALETLQDRDQAAIIIERWKTWLKFLDPGLFERLVTVGETLIGNLRRAMVGLAAGLEPFPALQPRIVAIGGISDEEERFETIVVLVRYLAVIDRTSQDKLLDIVSDLPEEHRSRIILRMIKVRRQLAGELQDRFATMANALGDEVRHALEVSTGGPPNAVTA
jgi:hypothetical protein